MGRLDDGTQAPSTKIDPPLRETLANLIVVSLQSLEERLIRNSWRHHIYSFSQEEGQGLDRVELIRHDESLE